MRTPQPEMREPTGEVREQPPSAAHASRTAGPARRISTQAKDLWRIPLVRGLALSAAIGLFLSAVGAFGSGGVSFWVRTLWFLAFALFAGLAGFSLSRWATRLPWTRDHLLRRYLVVATLMTLIMALAVWLALGAATGGVTLAALPGNLLFSFVTSFAATALVYLIFRPTPVTHAGPAGAAAPRFLARLPAGLRGGEVWAVEAEDHYLRIHSSRGSDLILMRLADAIAELEGIEGAQTHRSWWVARAALKDVKRSDGRATLVLPNGKEAPVSRTYARTLREAGWF